MPERDIRIVVADNVKRYMAENGVNRRKLGLAIGFASVGRILDGSTVNGCTIMTLQRTAEVLGVKIIDLIEDWGDEDE